MTEKQINNWLRRRFSPVGWILVGDCLLMNFIVSLTMTLDTWKQMLWNLKSGNFLMDLDMDALYNNGWGYIGYILVVFSILLAWKGGSYWRQLLTRREGKMRAMPLFASLSFCIGAQLINSLWISGLEWGMNQFDHSIMPMLESVSGAAVSFSMFLYGCVVAPLAEELLFRGFVLENLRPYGKRFAILGSAVLFGLIHGNLLQLPYAFMMGLLLGYLAVEYSLGWAIFLHIFNNLVLGEGLGRLSECLPAMMADVLNLALMGTFLLISLGILIRNRAEIRQYRRSEWIDRRCVRCFFTSPGILVLTIAMLLMMGNIFYL